MSTKGSFKVNTSQRMQFVDITARLQEEISRSGIDEGVCLVYNPHTTAGLTINEGADPAVRDDIIAALQIMVPMRHPFRHQEGNSPAHIMASLMGSSVSMGVERGRLQLGTWQKVFFCEFDGPRSRQVTWRLIPG